MKLSLSSLPALTFYAFPLQTTWVWLFQENVKHFKGQAALFARHLLSLFSWSCLLSCPGDFLWCIDFLISPSIFPCLHWLTVAETGRCFSKQICSPMPTGISCLQEPPFTRYQLFENICAFSSYAIVYPYSVFLKQPLMCVQHKMFKVWIYLYMVCRNVRFFKLYL